MEFLRIMSHITRYNISPYIKYVDYACIVYTDGGVNRYNNFINSDSGGISILSTMHTLYAMTDIYTVTYHHTKIPVVYQSTLYTKSI